jgi:hypothetical protein
MPYIIMKRSDIPDGTLQVLDMEPNTSQRNYTLDAPGQTKYVNAVDNQTVVTLGAGPVTSFRDYSGLAAWFLARTNDGTAVAAAGSVDIAAGNAADGDTVTVNASAAGGPSVTFTFRAAPTAATDVLVGGTEDASATNLANAINNPFLGLAPYVGAVAPGGGPPSPVTITAVTAGAAGNTILLGAVGANLSTVAMAGGVDAMAISAADANASALAVLGQFAFGDLTAAAGVLDLATVNGVLVGAVLDAASHAELMDMLAGAKFELAAGTQVADAGGFHIVSPPTSPPSGNRAVFLNDGLPLSFVMGELAEFTDSAFVYAGVAGNPNGEAVVVYNNDGTFFTP